MFWIALDPLDGGCDLVRRRPRVFEMTNQLVLDARRLKPDENASASRRERDIVGRTRQ